MLLPALSKARAKARAISCLSNQKQIGLFVTMYGNDNDDYVPPQNLNSTGMDPYANAEFTGSLTYHGRTYDNTDNYTGLGLLMKGGYVHGSELLVPQWGASWEVPAIFNCPVSRGTLSGDEWQIQLAENCIYYLYLGGFRYCSLTQSGQYPRERLSRDAGCTLLVEGGVFPHGEQINALYLGGHAKAVKPGNGYTGYNYAETFDFR